MRKMSHRKFHFRWLMSSLAAVMSVLSLAGQTQTDTLAQYLNRTFIKSTVKTRSGTSYSLNLNYNIVSEKMVFIQKGSLFDLGNPETADTVYLGGKMFIPKENCFLEVVSAGKISFFIRHKGELTSPPQDAGYGTTAPLSTANLSGGLSAPQGFLNLKLPEGYLVRKNDSWMMRDGDTWTRFYNENQLLKALPGMEKELKQFIKDNRLKVSRPDDLVKIGKFLNKS
jgi:hypothetical protein